MKRIFVLYTSNEGVYTQSFTNVKALFTGLGKVKNYMPLRIKNKPYSYSTLLKEIRSNQEQNNFAVCKIDCDSNKAIGIFQVELIKNSVN